MKDIPVIRDICVCMVNETFQLRILVNLKILRFPPLTLFIEVQVARDRCATENVIDWEKDTPCEGICLLRRLTRGGN